MKIQNFLVDKIRIGRPYLMILYNLAVDGKALAMFSLIYGWIVHFR